MNVYRTTFGNGDTIDLELPGPHYPPEIILRQVAEHPAGEVASFITRDPGTPAERVVWRRLDANRSERTIRLFVSFVYDDASDEEPAGTVIHEYGNTIIDIEFEPFDGDHIDMLQAKIGLHINAHKVIILGWQRIEQP